MSVLVFFTRGTSSILVVWGTICSLMVEHFIDIASLSISRNYHGSGLPVEDYRFGNERSIRLTRIHPDKLGCSSAVER
jgi:hypothetical protein